METANNRSRFIKGFKRIALVHLVGLLGIVLVTALFFVAATCISYTGLTLMDMKGFQLVEEISDRTDRYLMPYYTKDVDANGLTTNYYLIDAEAREEPVTDLAKWDVAGSAWTSYSGDIFFVSNITALSTENSAITFDLPAHDSPYYIYTFPGYVSGPPPG